MDYRQAEDYLHSFVDYEMIPGISFASSDYNLLHVQELLHRMGDPHLAARTVHIAGTKGKGSIAAMIAQVLTISSYKTGLYTSPHLHSLRERIRVDGSLISQLDFASLVAEAKPHLESINLSPAYRQPTFFEALTALAFASQTVTTSVSMLVTLIPFRGSPSSVRMFVRSSHSSGM